MRLRLNRFSAKLTKLSKFEIRQQWLEISAPANCRRAKGCLYVWEIVFTVQRNPCTSLETAFTVQRALRTFRGKGHPVQKGHPCHPGAAKVGPNLLKFQVMKKTYKEP